MTTASGWLLVLAGYLAFTGSWAAGALITLPSGAIILAAFATAARADRIGAEAAVDDRALVPGVAVVAMTLLAGAVMFFAGYAIATWDWTPAFALTTLGTLGALIVTVAFVLDRRV
jgi:hypothetical protein